MGEVYRATDTRLQREVAIKVLPADRMADGERKARFIQEARAASALNHPNIVAIYDISEAAGIDFLVMELVRGKTLDQAIGRQGMRLGDTLRYGMQIADALSKAHGAGIVHRDLKPSNVMVNEDGVIKLLDFGLAKLEDVGGAIGDDDATRVARREVHSREGAILGTVSYMAPEQAEGKKVDSRADVFSFGALLYEMVTGQRAFAGDSAASTLASVIKTDPKPPSQLVADMPRDLEKTILRCLRKDPARRFQHVSDIKVELEDIKEDSDSGRLTASVAVAPSRSKKPLLVGAAIALPLVAAAGLYLRPRGESAQRGPTTEMLTTYEGRETYPTFSPDGNQVAFTWGGEKGSNEDIYVKVVGSANALRVTTDPAPDRFPAWSPDGRQIAFLRENAIYLIPPIGGQERKLAAFAGVEGRISWSPDGKWIAVAQSGATQEANGVVLVSAEGAGRRRLTTHEGRGFDAEPAFSPDGRRLAFVSCVSGWSCVLKVVDLAEDVSVRGKPRRLEAPPVPSPSLAWTADGEAILYDRKYGGYAGGWSYDHLWKISMAPGAKPQRLDYTGVRSGFPVTSRSGDKLAYSLAEGDLDVWKWEAGRTEKVLASTLNDFLPDYSPDGRKIAFQSMRSGRPQVWVVNADGSGPVQLTASTFSGSPKWSPDGRWITYDQQDAEGRFGIWVIDSSGGEPRRLSQFGSQPSFSRDGKWVYFSGVHRVPFAGGEPVRITESGAAPMESWDGKSVYYKKGRALFVRSLEGGPERQVLDQIVDLFDVAEGGIYYFRREGDAASLERMDPATGKIEVLGRLEQRLHFGASVSPDGKRILYSVDSSGGDLRLVENFH